MNFKMVKTALRWLAPVALVGVGLAVGQGMTVSRANQAQAATAAMAPLDRLLAEDEIRQKLALYVMLADGSGPGGKPRDMNALANDLMTADVVSEMHPANGGAPRVFTGRESILQTPREQADPSIAGRHYIVGTYFDDISPTTAHTRSTAIYFDMTRNMLGADCRKAGPDACGDHVMRGVMWIYEMTWTKTPEGWKISKNVLRDDT